MTDNGPINLSEAFYRQLLNSMDEGVYFVDRERRIVFWNQGAEQLSGYSAGQVQGSFCGDGFLMHVDFDGNLLCGDGCPLKACMEDGETYQMDVFLKHHDGHRVPVRVVASPVVNEENVVIGAVERFGDIAPQLADRSKLVELAAEANTDPLTEIANRRFVEMALQERLVRFDKIDETFGVMFFDLDQLKEINDQYGHSVGDQAIKLIAKTLRGIFRSDDVVGRWGGDEFLVILGKVDLTILENLKTKVKKIIHQTKLPGEFNDWNFSISVGLAVVQRGDSVESLVRRADISMYDDKRLNYDKE